MRSAREARTMILAALLAAAGAQAGTLSIESWRVDDKGLWESVLIPAFERKHPGVKVKFAPTAPTEYDSSLAARLAGGTAGELVTCRPFDGSLSLYRKGFLDKLDGKPGMENFAPTAKVAWQSDDGKDGFCMPMASVIHGFLFNKKIFARLKLSPPKTEAEFVAVLNAVKKDGSAAPLALGTADQWESTQILFTSLGANCWKGESGRKALIAGKASVRPFAAAGLPRPGNEALAVGIGIAGANHAPWAAAFVALQPHFGVLVVDNDAVTTLLGAHEGRPGAVLAVGTGSVGAALRADGVWRLVGGWGFPTGDEGSGAWLGQRALAHLQHVVDGRLPSSDFAAGAVRRAGRAAATLSAGGAAQTCACTARRFGTRCAASREPAPRRQHNSPARPAPKTTEGEPPELADA